MLMFFVFVLNLAVMVLELTVSQLMSTCCGSFVCMKATPSVCVCLGWEGGGGGEGVLLLMA